MREFLTVVVAAFVAFMVMLLSAAMGLVQLALGLVSAVMLLCAVFTGIGFLVTHRAHEGIDAAGFLFYSAVPFVAIVVLRVYWDKLLTYRSPRTRMESIGRLRLARDVRFSD